MPQTPAETIGRLSDRLSPSTLLADRRAAVLSLKGLVRDHKQIVGEQALSGLLEIIQNDAEIDRDIGRAALETTNMLCESLDTVRDQRDTGLANSDRILKGLLRSVWLLRAVDNPSAQPATANPGVLLKCPSGSVSRSSFTGRIKGDDEASGIAVMLSCWPVPHESQCVRAFCLFLKTALHPQYYRDDSESLGERFYTLSDEKIKSKSTELIILLGGLSIPVKSVVLIAAMIRQSTEIQKILAFEGVFEKLFNIITQEGGLDGGMFVEDILKIVDTLLRYNTSNQSYFRETSLPLLLCSLLYFDPNIQLHEPVPQEFALQFWSPDKTNCVLLVLEIIGLLLGAKGTGLKEGSAFMRLLIEMALASNAPTKLKVRCLTLLPESAVPILPDLILTPYVPVPETNGEEWDRLEAATGIDALLELIMHGEYNGMDAGRRKKDGLDLRAAAVGVFENFLRDDHVKEAIVAGMLPPQDAGPSARSPMTPLLFGLILPPRSPPDRVNIVSFQFATVLFAHLVRHAPHCKSLARSIIPPTLSSMPEPGVSATGGNFFVPADGAPTAQGQPEPEPEEPDEEPQTLLQLLTEHLSLSFLSRSRAGLSDQEQREWDRIIVSYLSLFGQWLWEDPKAVREFLEAGGLGMLVEQVNQPSAVDFVVPGLCAFLLGLCYEFSREPGEITRETIFPIIKRLGVDVLVGRINRVREDERIKVVGPELWVLPCPTPKGLNPTFKPMEEGEAEIWFDWAFVDFWKSNYYTVQRGLVADPASASSSTAQSGEESVLVASLRDVIAKQAAEIDALKDKLSELSASTTTANTSFNEERAALQDQVASLSAELVTERAKQAEAEKEQEDLLVLLDELSTKRTRDKGRMRDAGIEVSEDEGDDDNDEGDDDE
ncbi:hypothetical protein EW146_g4110 [Bondarzewia mesenterica]|uniref:Vesicle tethering protein Uso1/P115-like head domain-containing protein n=1 Tax=Bondarzewia mesenterica TaxID=1095465 RepID=A0A4S4LVI5_9AGAM|nr:hypothetical protein EW146_g4110 [Bondarzewia mesenterica]